MTMEISQVRCVICDTVGNWKIVDEFRVKPVGMSMCQTCGFITYPAIIAKQSELKEYYREEYRDVPNIQSVYSGQRKLHYHKAFLNDLIQVWKKAKYEPIIGEIGGAFGLFLNWIKGQVPGAEVFGTELTLSYRRNAWHEFGILLTEEFDTSRQYDLICSYKVAEHIPNIDAEIKKYASCLKPEGKLYISVPAWFGTLANHGESGFALEKYFHTNHVNVWTRRLFEALLKKCGFQIEKSNHTYYDETYLCVYNPDLIDQPREYENPTEMLEKLGKVRAASLAFDAGKFEEAISHWPNFPDAHQVAYESTRAQKHHQGGFEEVKAAVDRANAMCPESAQILLWSAELCMRYDQWKLAIGYLDQGLQHRPNDPGALQALGHCFRHLSRAAADPKEKLRFLEEARDVMRHLKGVSLQLQAEAMNWMMNDNAKLPLPEELTKGFTPGFDADSGQPIN